MSENIPSQPPENARKLSPEAASRRLIMLRGLGKGSAVVTAASLPLSTLAQGSSLLTPKGDGGTPNLRCSVSGMQSKVADSNIPNDARICGGYSPGWWGQKKSDGTPRRSWPTDHTAKCKYLFTRCESDDPGRSLSNKTLFEVMSNSTYSSTKTRHWIGAYLNGLSGGAPGYPFPYSGAAVMSFYNSADNVKRAKFYELVTTYLETHGET